MMSNGNTFYASHESRDQQSDVTTTGNDEDDRKWKRDVGFFVENVHLAPPEFSYHRTFHKKLSFEPVESITSVKSPKRNIHSHSPVLLLGLSQ